MLRKWQKMGQHLKLQGSFSNDGKGLISWGTLLHILNTPMAFPLSASDLSFSKRSLNRLDIVYVLCLFRFNCPTSKFPLKFMLLKFEWDLDTACQYQIYHVPGQERPTHLNSFVLLHWRQKFLPGISTKLRGAGDAHKIPSTPLPPSTHSLSEVLS